jgi:hypothetical protein
MAAVEASTISSSLSLFLLQLLLLIALFLATATSLLSTPRQHLMSALLFFADGERGEERRGGPALYVHMVVL